MIKNSTSLIFAATVLLTAAGCKYDGSFMQMDSNSGSPFFGLQWAVDSGSRPSRSAEKCPQMESLRFPDAASGEHSTHAARSLARPRFNGPPLCTVSTHGNSAAPKPAISHNHNPKRQ